MHAGYKNWPYEGEKDVQSNLDFFVKSSQFRLYFWNIWDKMAYLELVNEGQYYRVGTVFWKMVVSG